MYTFREASFCDGFILTLLSTFTKNNQSFEEKHIEIHVKVQRIVIGLNNSHRNVSTFLLNLKQLNFQK